MREMAREKRLKLWDKFRNLKEAQESGQFEWVSHAEGWSDPFKGKPVASVFQELEDGAGTGLPGRIEVSYKDARRIIATWNACAGISTEALEQGVIPDAVEALQNMSGGFDTPVQRRRAPFDTFQEEAVASMRAALSKLEPGK